MFTLLGQSLCGFQLCTAEIPGLELTRPPRLVRSSVLGQSYFPSLPGSAVLET